MYQTVCRLLLLRISEKGGGNVRKGSVQDGFFRRSGGTVRGEVSGSRFFLGGNFPGGNCPGGTIIMRLFSEGDYPGGYLPVTANRCVVPAFAKGIGTRTLRRQDGSSIGQLAFTMKVCATLKLKLKSMLLRQ